MKIKSKKWEMSVEERKIFQIIKDTAIAVVAEYLAVSGPTLTVVGYMLWIAYSAGINELALYPYKGVWLLATAISLSMAGVFGLAIRASRVLWKVFDEQYSDLLTDDMRAAWPSWLK